MNAQDNSRLIDSFKAIVRGKNFIPFDELGEELGVTNEVLVSLKQAFEEALREEDPEVSLTSRVDLSPPGFEISD